MSKKINPPPSIFIRRLDSITFELVEVRDGQEKVLLKEVYTFIKMKTDIILQQMAEGLYP